LTILLVDSRTVILTKMHDVQYIHAYIKVIT
jgi:hypothetical protein